MSDKIMLRTFTKDDVPAITKIYCHYVRNSAATFDLEEPSEEEMEKKYSAIKGAGHPLIIAEVDGELAGFAYASTYRPRRAYRFTCESSIYLDPRMVGRGLGDLVLKELIKQSAAFGFNQMIAIITAGTDNSIRLHEKNGFTILGKFPQMGFKFDRWHDIIHMQRKL